MKVVEILVIEPYCFSTVNYSSQNGTHTNVLLQMRTLSGVLCLEIHFAVFGGTVKIFVTESFLASTISDTHSTPSCNN